MAHVYKPMQGPDDQKEPNEIDKYVLGELDERILLKALGQYVEESELSIPKIASLMGVFSATLSMWIAGSARPSGTDLFVIKRFLEERDLH